MSSAVMQKQLNALVGSIATVKGASFGWSALLHYQPLLKQVLEENGLDKFEHWLSTGGCYVFEVGLNCGTVFSANMVEKIELTETGAIIHLKH